MYCADRCATAGMRLSRKSCGCPASSALISKEQEDLDAWLQKVSTQLAFCLSFGVEVSDSFRDHPQLSKLLIKPSTKVLRLLMVGSWRVVSSLRRCGVTCCFKVAPPRALNLVTVDIFACQGGDESPTATTVSRSLLTLRSRCDSPETLTIWKIRARYPRLCPCDR